MRAARMYKKIAAFSAAVVTVLVGTAAAAFAVDGYPPTVPPQDPVVKGEVVTRGGESASSGLAFTGSSHTLTYVLVAVALVAVGLALVFIARRRTRVA